MTIDVETLRAWLEEEKPVFILDVRPKEQRDEWQIPGSNYLDAYQRLKAGDTSVMDEIKIPENMPVVTVCEAGRTSKIAANELMKRGIEVYSLEGGMRAWSLAWNVAELKNGDLKIIQIRRTGKGCLSYLIGSGNESIVLDASVGTDAYINLAQENNWKIKYVLDTHIHADHLSRSADLARIAAAELYLPDQDKVKFRFNKIHNGDVLKFGSSRLKAIHTPGHTLESTSYFVNDQYLFTGDTLFTDGIGRPDLKASDEGTRERASLLYDSLQEILKLDEHTFILPAHIGKPVPFDHSIIGSTLGELKTSISSLGLSKKDFIETILSKIPPTPPNYLRIVELNLEGDIGTADPKEIEAGANRCAIS